MIRPSLRAAPVTSAVRPSFAVAMLSRRKIGAKGAGSGVTLGERSPPEKLRAFARVSHGLLRSSPEFCQGVSRARRECRRQGACGLHAVHARDLRCAGSRPFQPFRLALSDATSRRTLSREPRSRSFGGG